MSKTTVKAAITQALQTPKGRAQVSKAEAEAITRAALTEPRGAAHITADEAKLIDQLLRGDAFDAGPRYQLTAPARQVLEAFAAAQGLPIGSNVDAVKARAEGVLAAADLGAPLAKAPSTSSLLKLTLSDNRPSDGALREALINPTTGSFYLKTTSQGRGQPKPVVGYYGPFSLSAAVTPPAGGKLGAAELGQQVTQAAQGYYFPSETDVPLTWLTGPKVSQVTASGVVSAFAAQHDAQSGAMFGTSSSTRLADKHLQEVPAADFLSRYSQAFDPGDDASVASAQKFASVAALLQANLTDLHVYRFSEGHPGSNIEAPGQVSIFIAGRAASGELVSVMTAAVET